MTALLESSPGLIAKPDKSSGRVRPFTVNSGLLLPAVALVLIVFVTPVCFVVAQSFSDPSLGLQNYQWLFSTGRNLEVILRTLGVALAATFICALLGYPYAYLMSISGPRLRGILTALVILPFWTSMMVRTFAWVIILQDNGLLNSLLGIVGLPGQSLLGTTWAVLIGMCQVLMPFMVLPMASTMQSIDQKLPLAAQIMGASPARGFWTVYFPLSLPGVLAGGLMVFILSLGFYVTPAILGSPRDQLLPNALYTQILELLNWGQGGALAVALLIIVAGILLCVAGLGRLFRVQVADLGGTKL